MGIGGLAGVLRFEANFGLYPLSLGLYELVVSRVEGAFGGVMVANEEAEVLGDGAGWWYSLMRPAKRALSSSGSSPAMSLAVLEAQPCDRLLRQDLAFPPAVFGPHPEGTRFCAFNLSAVI